MRKKTFFFFLITFLFISPCLAETAQEVTIPGYSPPSTQTTPQRVEVETVSPPKKTTPAKNQPIPATEEELQNLMASVDLSAWSVIAPYLWTCTPSQFSLPMYDAKNDILDAFNGFKTNKKILTKETATQITKTLGSPVSYQIPGLMAVVCRVNIAVTNVKKPYNLKCLFLIREARYLAQLARAVADNSGKAQPVSDDVLKPIQDLINSKCTKE